MRVTREVIIACMAAARARAVARHYGVAVDGKADAALRAALAPYRDAGKIR